MDASLKRRAEKVFYCNFMLWYEMIGLTEPWRGTPRNCVQFHDLGLEATMIRRLYCMVQVLNTLMRDPRAKEFFNEPVDDGLYGLEDYFTVIRVGPRSVGAPARAALLA
jgi:hypothetical protein